MGSHSSWFIGRGCTLGNSSIYIYVCMYVAHIAAGGDRFH